VAYLRCHYGTFAEGATHEDRFRDHAGTGPCESNARIARILLAEDKADVNARVGWSKMGINLKTNTPRPQMLRDAVRIVLDTDRYRLRASLMAEEFQLIDTRSEILRAIDEVSQNSADSSSYMMAARQGQRIQISSA
jgi:hypothetical protein